MDLSGKLKLLERQNRELVNEINNLKDVIKAYNILLNKYNSMLSKYNNDRNTIMNTNINGISNNMDIG